MKPLNICVLLISIILLVMACDNDSVGPNDELCDNDTVRIYTDMTPVEVHILSGFAGHQVIMKIDGNEYLRTQLSTTVPLAAPMLNFKTQLPQGVFHLSMFWGLDTQTWWGDSVQVVLGDSAFYYLSVNTHSDTLQVTIQDTPFYYL